MIPKVIIGRKEIADFPQLQLFDVDVKIDTGAFTSTIYCSSIRIEDNTLYCIFLCIDISAYTTQEHAFEHFSSKRIKSSNGMVQQRYQISTNIVLGGQVFELALTLSNRAQMRYPVLLGRKFLHTKYLVDVSKAYKLLKRMKKL